MTLWAAFNIALGVLALGLTVMYLSRVSRLEWGVQRNDYVGLHVMLGVGCLVAGLKLLSGSLIDWPSFAAIASAVCHLSVTHQPGQKFAPPSYMNSTRADL